TVDDFFSFSYYPDVLVYDKFNYSRLPKLLEKLNTDHINDFVHDQFSNNHKVLVIPSGEWMGDEYSEVIKEALKQFVESGGTLLVLAQQYDYQIENLVPVPEGETLKTFGWRQDQSCDIDSTYFDTLHPIVSSVQSEKFTAAVDGYLSAWPSNSTVVLNRIKNKAGTLLYYPYGEGTVILTSLYTDWGATHSQATAGEVKVFRDLITFARNPKLPIPMFDLSVNAAPQIDLNVTVTND
ncbi:MAG: hypothetical protein GY940_32760, partial [bacterium]|nr:hypothetical protein [bacterium]